jgi:hypothetical protein
MSDEATYRIPAFEVGKVFPADDPRSVFLVRFLLASQCLAAIARLPEELPDTPAFDESSHYLMLLALGATHEAAIAFYGANENGLFDPLKNIDDEEMNKRLARLIKEANRKDPESLQSKLVTHGRHKFGFHWDPEEIQKSLTAISGLVVPAWSGGEDQTVKATAIPLAQEVTLKGMEMRAGSKENLAELISRVAQFQGDLFHVAHAAYTVALAEVLKPERTRSGGGESA